MSLPLKAGIGLVTVGTIGGVGYGIVAYSQDKGTEISKLIEEEFQYKLLDTTEGDQDKDKKYWEINWRNYRDDNIGKANDLFGLEGWNKDNTGDSYEALKKKCKELSKSKVSGNTDTTYEDVIRYCGRGVTLAEQAAKDNLEILDTTGEDHATIWKNRFTVMDTTKNHLDRLGVVQNPFSGEEIKNGCDKAKERNKQEKDYASVYESYKLICTKQEGEEETELE